MTADEQDDAHGDRSREHGWRIEELAHRTGMTVRNIREHQSRGLLQPPTLRGRVGFYGPGHAARLDLVKRLQAEGFTLESIRRMVAEDGRAMRRFAEAVHEAFDAERPRAVTADDLTSAWNTDDASLLDLAVELDLLRLLPDGRYIERSPRLTRIGAELVALGIPPRAAIETAGEALRSTREIAAAFARTYQAACWEPFDEAGRPAERWPELLAALTSLRPLALDAVNALFGIAIDEAAEAALTMADGAGGAAEPAASRRPDHQRPDNQHLETAEQPTREAPQVVAGEEVAG
jgi:DNA-binding transcriptional MerR regulator